MLLLYVVFASVVWMEMDENVVDDYGRGFLRGPGRAGSPSKSPWG